MEEKEDIKKIIDEFFANASEQDLLELQSLLERQKPKINKSGVNSINVNKIATNFTTDIRKRMGVTSDQITRSAREAVRTMMYNYDPNIPEEQIRMLLEKWVPDKQKQFKRIPADTMRAMISQFAAYGRGELTEAQLAAFPEGWAKKYWSFFPEKMQWLIKAYIQDKISKTDFWKNIEKLLIASTKNSNSS